MKNTILISCPIDSKSGYGYHSRDIVKSLFNLYRDQYDIKIFSVSWGGTPNGALNKNIPEDVEILNNIIIGQLPKRPEIYINISVPNEFQPVGQYLNIGITAGIETTIASQEWIEGCNRMDLILVPSEHSKAVFMATQWEQRETSTNNVIKIIKIEKPIEVLFEGINTAIFNSMVSNTKIINDINEIEEQFLFLSVGHWLPGEFGEDRKNVSGLIHTFLDTFKNKEQMPGLVLKISGGTYSTIDYFNIHKKIAKIKNLFNGAVLPNIYILHGDLNDVELNDLYNHPKIAALVSFTKGEGYGRPFAEFSVTGKPIIASKWSGHLDFLSPKHCILLNGTLTKVHNSVVWDKVIIQDSSWFTVNYQEASEKLLDVYNSYNIYLRNSQKQKDIIKNFTLQKMEIKMDELLNNKLSSVPKLLDLKLPTLKRL